MPKRLGEKSNRIKRRKKKKVSLDFHKKRTPKLGRQTIPRKSQRRKLKKKRRLKDLNLRSILPEMGKIKKIGSWILQIAVVLLFAFVFVWYFGQRVSTVGNSMNPVLSNGDVVMVNRFVYNTRSPKRGDIIVFKPKGNENSHYYIKRVVGLPGETIEILEGSLYINGEKLEETYDTTDISEVGVVTDKMTLGGDEYFVLGDDRGRSEDSRMADVGNVKRGDIYGKAWLLVSPMDHFRFL